MHHSGNLEFIAYKFKKMLYERKKAEVEKSISFDDNHAIEEVCQYVQEQWGFKEADRNSAEYKFMYKQIKHDMNSEDFSTIMGCTLSDGTDIWNQYSVES